MQKKELKEQGNSINESSSIAPESIFYQLDETKQLKASFDRK